MRGEGHNLNRQKDFGLYDPSFEHDNCGIGSVVNIKGIQSRGVVDSALKIVERLEHRAGKDAEGKTGDGVGILLQISHDFFSKACAEEGIKIGGEREYGVGMFFFPQSRYEMNWQKSLFEVAVQKEGMEFLGWREVPVFPEVLGSVAREYMPHIVQGFVKKPDGCAKGIEFDRKLYVLRRVFEKTSKGTYVPSLSSRTIVYKGMFLVHDLRLFYKDLQDESYKSVIALVHSRYSTNTMPSWEKAHPNRMIVHNGEINTITGNQDKMKAREERICSHVFSKNPSACERVDKLLPIIKSGGTDSARFDNAIEFMVMAGMDLPLAIMITIPEPWDNNGNMDMAKRDFYQYYATMMEPWDGPASILFSDGDVMGACLDRNGLRPSRYYITDDDMLILSSEVGVMDVEPEKVLVKERLRPGRMLLVDTVRGEVISDGDIKAKYAHSKPYGEWLADNLLHLKNLKIPNKGATHYDHEQLVRLQKAFGYNYEEIRTGILTMAKTGAEIVEAMGVDSPIPALSDRNPPLFSYFKQLFAQVTNPPFDAIREEIVTSTTVYLGKSGNILEELPENCRMLRVNNPILTSVDMLKIKGIKGEGFKSAVIPIVYYKTTTLEEAIKQMFRDADKAVSEGANILILSDRDIDELRMPIPSLLAVSALHQHLVSNRKRTALSLVLESAEPREVHHFATLLGFGASAINPYLALETINDLIATKALDKEYYAAEKDYTKAVLKGIVKIASKIGISTIQSYMGSKIFEAIGISPEVINEYFKGTVSRIGGITLDDIEKRSQELHKSAFDPMGLYVQNDVPSGGIYKFRSGKEEHLYNPQTVHLLQLATANGDYSLFKQFSAQINDETKAGNIRSLFEVHYPAEGIPLDEVESVEEIVKRFKTGAMSYGSISQEAHETMAIAMNMLGGKSNSGEGGESPERLKTNACSAIKQVASGRFGVTSEYLVSAKEIQIKMAQGAKPGEGGQLPAGKVYPWVAKTRHSTPGVGLISPPPHHDIYSIEDLAQLIYDLKNANKNAAITVKLVSEAGVGTVATGVAKAGANVILISGYDGGTGAAPRNSIQNAGLPWELGLAEAHQLLIENNLRTRVKIETDGKLMTGRDVLVAALLGAEEFGFATAPLITMGCVMMRVCNLDTCPVGIATQNPELRKRFKGKPEYVVNFMRFVAEELREHMARLGVRTFDELVGRTDLLRMKCFKDDTKAAKIDLSRILYNPHALDRENSHFISGKEYDFALEKTIDEREIIPAFAKAFEKGTKKTIKLNVSNTDRALGTLFGAEITKKFGSALEDDTFVIKAQGSGGQSFGAFIPKGLTLELEGDSNDYFGKGLSGGSLIVYPPKKSRFKADENILIGNVALYGATSGSAFINGVAGERFCVRNSGARAVVEGVGDHGCEYMTGGTVVVLGGTGKNFGAGMSGGVAYVLDEDNSFYLNFNRELASAKALSEQDEKDISVLKGLIAEHFEKTGSPKARLILDNFESFLPKFKKVLPYDYARMLEIIEIKLAQGVDEEKAVIDAFYENVGSH